MFHKQIVIDAKGHLLGRLASYVAKQLLSGILLLIVKGKKLLLLELKLSTSQAPSLEIKSDSLSF
jgi:hypothetical protein